MTPGTLITLACTGAESAKADVPALPVTVEEVAAAARDGQAVGAAVLHLHVRDTDTRPTLELPRVREVVAAVDPDDLVEEADDTRAAARDRVRAVRSATMRPETTRS